MYLKAPNPACRVDSILFPKGEEFTWIFFRIIIIIIWTIKKQILVCICVFTTICVSFYFFYILPRNLKVFIFTYPRKVFWVFTPASPSDFGIKLITAFTNVGFLLGFNLFVNYKAVLERQFRCSIKKFETYIMLWRNLYIVK